MHVRLLIAHLWRTSQVLTQHIRPSHHTEPEDLRPITSTVTRRPRCHAPHSVDYHCWVCCPVWMCYRRSTKFTLHLQHILLQGVTHHTLLIVIAGSAAQCECAAEEAQNLHCTCSIFCLKSKVVYCVWCSNSQYFTGGCQTFDFVPLDQLL